VLSSSSLLLSSSSRVIAVVYSDPVTDEDGQTYEAVVIGSQTWIAKNFNRNVGGSKCYNDSDINCTIYGRLYDWATVMGGAAGSDKYPSEVQGICPAGFHIPSDVEWTVLTEYVGDYKKLRTTSGWDARYENSNYVIYNGTDDYGFSALPAGRRYYDSRFTNVGYNGYWWSATEKGTNSTSALIRNGAEDKNIGLDGDRKSNMYSLRCVKDFQPSNKPSYIPVSCPNIPAGSFCDDRNGKTYRSVTIGNQIWMAENLNYKAESSLCYGETTSTEEESQANCALYGRLYTWIAAMAIEPACDNSYCISHLTSPHQGVCPGGWHLPTVEEANELIETAGGASTAGQILKATSGWSSGNGIDAFGFSALPGGYGGIIGYDGYDNIFFGAGTSTTWWNVAYTVSSGDINSRYEWGMGTGIGVTKPNSLYYSTNSGYSNIVNSIRCVKDSD
jgi:uncharacterized protein (TIGR02145 family)